MSTALKLPTVDDYFAADEADARKLEFIDGAIVAMAGGDPAHSRLAQKLGAALETRLWGHPCITFQSDLRVQIGLGGDYVYPDVTVACPPRHFLDTRPKTLATPTIVFEVLSPTTSGHDQGAKAAAYRRTPTLREYVVLSTEKRHAMHAVRRSEVEWVVRDYRDAAVLALPTLSIQVPLDEIYDGFEALRAELLGAG